MQGLGSLNLFLKISNYLKTCSTRFSETQNTLLHPELPHRELKVNSWSNTGFNLCRSRWQIPSLLLLFSDWQILLASASLSLTGKCQFVADRCSLKKDSMVCLFPRQTIQHHSNPSLCPHQQCWRSWSWMTQWKSTRPSRTNTKKKKRDVLLSFSS